MKQYLDLEALEQNLTDLVKESQIKLGYTKESIGFYYPLESLNRLLDSNLGIEDMMEALQQFSVSVRDTLGQIQVTQKAGRFCIRIPAEGVEYVHKTVSDSGFLPEFIEKISHCGESIEAILEVFYKYSSHVYCGKIEGGEFDYLIYFEDGKPDDYRYCIKLEGGCATYHRFAPKEYEALGFQ